MRWSVGHFLLPHAGPSRVACLICPGTGDRGSHCLPMSISSAPAWRLVCFHRRRASAEDMFSGGYSRPHHLIISSYRTARATPFSSSSGVASSSPAFSILIGCGYRAAGGGIASRHFPRSHMSWVKRRMMRFFAHCPLMSSGFSFLFSSRRLVRRLVPHHRRGVRSWRVSGLAVLLVGVSSWRRRHSFVLRRGGVLVLILRLPSRSLLAPSSRAASRCSSPHVLRAGAAGRACSSHRGRSSCMAWSAMAPGCLAVLARLV